MLKHFNRKLILFSLLFLYVFTANLLADKSVFQETSRNNQNWQKTSDELIVYSIEFHEINQEYVENSVLSTYISDSPASELELKYRDFDSEITLLQEASSAININAANYQLNEERRFQSYLITIENRAAEISLREKYLSVDSAREDKILFELSLQPEMIDYDRKQILTDIKFSHNSEQTINKLEMKNWVSHEINEPIAILTKKSIGSGKEKNSFFLIYLSARVISGEEINDLNKISKITDITQIAEIFRSDYSYNNTESRIKGELDADKILFNFSHDRGNLDYSLEVSKKFSKQGFIYKFNGGIGLYPEEGLFFRTIISNGPLSQENEGSYLPVFRFGLADSISWRDSYTFTTAYYPLLIRTAGKVDNHLLNLALSFQNERWKASYTIDFIGGKNQQRLSLGYIFSDNKDLSLNYTNDFFGKNRLSIAFEIPFKLEGAR
ncbi:MAG: hypothetical protein ACOCRL_02420 [Bacillota bacterium]